MPNDAHATPRPSTPSRWPTVLAILTTAWACASEGGDGSDDGTALTTGDPTVTPSATGTTGAGDAASNAATNPPVVPQNPATTPPAVPPVTGSPGVNTTPPTPVTPPAGEPPVGAAGQGNAGEPPLVPAPGGSGGAPVGGAGGTTVDEVGGAPQGGSGGTSSGASGASSGGDGGADPGGDGGSAGLSVGGGGSGGSPALGDTPCPTNGDPCKILPLGDSITDGIGSAGGYRVELFQLSVDAGKTITFVGGSMNGPDMVAGQSFPKSHEGHSGWTIQQIADIVPSPALNGEPHIVLLHIGTNDMYQTPAGAPDRLADLIDELIMDNPEALLVVSTIIPFPGATNEVSSYNGAVVDVVEERIDGGARLLLVDQFEGFPTSELGDGVHPNAAGYARMAGVWFEAIESYLR